MSKIKCYLFIGNRLPISNSFSLINGTLTLFILGLSIVFAHSLSYFLHLGPNSCHLFLLNHSYNDSFLSIPTAMLALVFEWFLLLPLFSLNPMQAPVKFQSLLVMPPMLKPSQVPAFSEHSWLLLICTIQFKS